ncbi:MAG: PqqD family protein [Aphanothece sp. CMT-3BRIN-NPC111]|jgi:hypothetical protein|nr:PqqD family protein [Aphanothece sp. CMT-3BRIN-NPC111]
MLVSESFIINSPKVVHETIDGEVVIINLEEGTYYSLVKVGADIWNAVERRISFGDLIEEIQMRYSGDKEEIEESVKALIKELQQEELIISNDVSSTQENSFSVEIKTSDNLEKIKFEIPKLEKYTDMQDLLLLDPIHEVEETGWPKAKVEVAE